MRILAYFSLFFNAVLLAHPLDLGVAKLEIQNDQVKLQVDLNKKLVEELLLLSDSALLTANVDTYRDKIFQDVMGEQSLSSALIPCVWYKEPIVLEGENVRILSHAKCGSQISEITFRPTILDFSGLPKGFQLVINIKNETTESVSTLSVVSRELHFSALKTGVSFKDFIFMGIDHIGASPSEWKDTTGFHLPDGIDHILFLLALLLAGGGIINVLKTITGFTVGHSVTLMLASLNILRLPSRFVESMIALSIAYVAIESVLFKKRKSRWQEASLFGLMHGFGFANALAELQLTGSTLVSALVGFNVGVEVGQVIITLCFFPLLYFIQKNEKFGRYFVPICSILIFLAASYWFVQRIN